MKRKQSLAIIKEIEDWGKVRPTAEDLISVGDTVALPRVVEVVGVEEETVAV